MARPAKSIDVQSGAIRNDATQARRTTENTLKGEAVQIVPSFALSEEQTEIFKKIKSLFEKAGLLGELDCYVLTEGAVVIDRLQQIDLRINNDPDLLFDRDVCNTRKEYMQNFFRICNELSLSPQSRAKMGILALGKDKQEKDPILQIFGENTENT